MNIKEILLKKINEWSDGELPCALQDFFCKIWTEE